MEEILQQMETAHLSLGKVLFCIGILVATAIVAQFVVRFVARIGEKEGNPLPSGSIFGNIARIFIWMFGIGTVLKIGFDVDITGIIAALGVGGIALSLGFQDTLSNLIGGLQVSLGKIVRPDMYVNVLNQTGRVADISWRHTTIVDFSGDRHLIPNSLINKNSLIIYDDTMSVDTEFRLPVTADIQSFSDEATELAKAAMGEENLGPKAVSVSFRGVTDAQIVGVITADVVISKLSPSGAKNRIMRAVEPAIKKAYSTT